MMLTIGSGRTPPPPRCRQSGDPLATRRPSAPPRWRRRGARSPRAATCPRSRRARRAARRAPPGRTGSRRRTAGPIVSRTFATASRTPLPPKRSRSPSRSSCASCRPVEAPDGTLERAQGAVGELELDLDGRPAAGVEDLARVYRRDRRRHRERVRDEGEHGLERVGRSEQQLRADLRGGLALGGREVLGR